MYGYIYMYMLCISINVYRLRKFPEFQIINFCNATSFRRKCCSAEWRKTINWRANLCDWLRRAYILTFKEIGVSCKALIPTKTGLTKINLDINLTDKSSLERTRSAFIHFTFCYCSVKSTIRLNFIIVISIAHRKTSSQTAVNRHCIQSSKSLQTQVFRQGFTVTLHAIAT